MEYFQCFVRDDLFQRGAVFLVSTIVPRELSEVGCADIRFGGGAQLFKWYLAGTTAGIVSNLSETFEN